MKHLSKFKPPFAILCLIPLTLLALLIWTEGPQLLVAGRHPLYEPLKRLALILTFFLIWGAKFLLWDQLKPQNPETLKLAQLTQALRGRFRGALRFLKKTAIEKHGSALPLSNLPWYLLIGPHGSGKTTLLQQAQVHYILSKQRKQELQEGTSTSSLLCDWWVTRDLVLVDVPGCYTFSPTKEEPVHPLHFTDLDPHTEPANSPPHRHLTLWQTLLQLILKNRLKSKMGALIISLNLPELLQQNKQQQHQQLYDLKQRLEECWSKFGNLPLYFFITKCDLLPGFSAFFKDIGCDELLQPWGIPLTGRKEQETILDLFNERFNALIKRLNKQLIWRLHQERQAELRPLIKDFPLQLEHLKEQFTHLLKAISALNPEVAIEGVYLSSATQTKNTASATTLFHYDLPSDLEELQLGPFVSRSYFIKHVISYLLPHTSQHLLQKARAQKPWLPQLAYGTGLLLLFLGTLELGKDYQRGLVQLSTVKRYLLQYQTYLQQNLNQDTPLTAMNKALPLLNTLRAATPSAEKHSALQHLETPYSTKSQETAALIYDKALQNLILPQLRNAFEKALDTSDEKSPEQLYSILKAYLLLGEETTELSSKTSSTEQQTTLIIQTLETLAPTFSKESTSQTALQPALLEHLEAALTLKKGGTLNHHLIKKTRALLNKLPATELAYLLVKNKGHYALDSELHFGTNIGTPPALISKGTMTRIPTLFTALAFDGVMKEDLALAAEEALNGNEVLGKKTEHNDPALSNTEETKALTQQLRKMYLNNYIDIWESLVDNIALNAPQTLTEADAIILNLISIHSPLLELLQTIHSNTNFELITESSPKLQALNKLFNQTQGQQKESLYEIFTDLGELHHLLQKTPINAKALPLTALTHLHNTLETYPEPIKNWLETLTNYTQTVLSANAPSKTINGPTLKEAPKKKTSPETALAEKIQKNASHPIATKTPTIKSASTKKATPTQNLLKEEEEDDEDV